MFLKKSCTGVSWIVVFLGNPGEKYTYTRHNVGFCTADEMEKLLSVRINRIKFHALTGVGTTGGQKVLFLKPQTFMNLSGTAVQEAMAYYKTALDHVLVISDDISLPVGKLRIRRSGSAGGHNGLKDIIAKCGGDGFPRVKIGVGQPPHPDYDVADWVLGTFPKEDAETIRQAEKSAAEAAVFLMENGVDAAMNRFN